MPGDALDRPRVADLTHALEAWLRDDRGSPGARVRRCRQLRGGMETWSYAVDIEAGPWAHDGTVVLRLHRWPDAGVCVDAERAALQWARARGLRSPRFIDGDPDDATALGAPFLVETFVDGTAAGQPWFIGPRRRRDELPRLAELQASLHDLDPSGADLARLDIASALDAVAGPDDSAGQEAVAWMREHAWIVARPSGESVLHLDLHPGNILRHAGHLAIIDWSQARLGDPAADVARTLEVLGLGALVVGIPPLVRWVTAPTTAAYLAAYERHRAVDPDRVRYWRSYHALVVRKQLLTVAELAAARGDGFGAAMARRGARVLLWRWKTLALDQVPPF